jgi:hypothetical protein
MLDLAKETAALLREKPIPILSLGSKRASHATRGSVAKTAYFLEHPLFGGDNGRVLPIEAWSGVRWLWKNR